MPRAKKFLDGKFKAPTGSDSGRRRDLAHDPALRSEPLSTPASIAEPAPAACSQFAGVRLMTLGDGVRTRRPHAGVPHRSGPALHRAGGPGDGHRRGRLQGHGDRLALRRPASAIRACTNMRARAAWPGRAAFPACWSPAGSTISWAAKRCPPDHYNYPGPQDRPPLAARRVGTIPARLTGYGEALGRRPLHPLGRRRGAAGDRSSARDLHLTGGSRRIWAATRSA